jgi:MFS family permease
VPLPPTAPFFAANFAWNFALGMTYMLVPLYARSQGLSGTGIGILLGIPVFVQMGLNLIGGALTDRIGGYRMAVGACLATGLGGAIYLFATSFAGMLAAQLVLAVGRAMFWPASWSLGTQLPGGEVGKRMGRLNSTGSAGQILGTTGAGVLLGGAGFAAGFGVYVLAALVAFVLMLRFRAPPRPSAVPQPVFTTYRALLSKRTMYFAMLCAYLSAIPFSLSQSFFPILFVDGGYSSDAAGTVVALRALGSIAAGLAIGRFVREVARYGVPMAAGLLTCGSVAVMPLCVDEPWLAGLFMLALGLGSGVMTIYFQVLVASLSQASQRGSAVALGAFGFSLSHLSTPVLMGTLQDTVGIGNAFHAIGLLGCVVTLCLVPAHRWAFRKR